MTDDAIVEALYEAAVVPEFWPSVLETLSAQTGSAHGLIVRLPPRGGLHVTSTRGAEELIGEYQALGLFERSERMPRLFGQPYAGFITDADIYTPDEQERDPAYTEFFWPKDLGIGAATALRYPDGETVLVDFERWRRAGLYERAQLSWLDTVRPHIARACTVSMRIEMERARARASALEAVGLPASVLDAHGRILTSNVLMEPFIPGTVLDRRQRVALANPEADALLGDALASGGQTGAARSIPLPRREDRPALVLHLLPIQRRAQDVFARAAHLLVLTVVAARRAPHSDLVEALFDLTPAEASVARLIGAGETTLQISVRLGTSRETVRTQLRAVFAKTGAKRQAELVALLGSITL